MIKNLLTAFIIGTISLKFINGQCENIAQKCSQYIKDGFLYDGSINRTILTKNQVGEFNTIFFSKTHYRITVCSGGYEKDVIFRVFTRKYSSKGDSLLFDYLIFNSKEMNNPAWWDFYIEETIPVTIEVELDPAGPPSGCIVNIIGFKK